MSAASSMLKSASFLQKGQRSIVDGFVIAYISSMKLLVFIVGDHNGFSC